MGKALALLLFLKEWPLKPSIIMAGNQYGDDIGHTYLGRESESPWKRKAIDKASGE